MKNAYIFSTQNSEYLAKEISRTSGIPFAKIDWVLFEDGEYEIQIDNYENYYQKNIIIVGSAENLRYFADLADLASTFRQQYRARKVNIIIPYTGYSTAERSKPYSGISPRGIYRVQSLFDTQPDKITFFDLHSDGLMNVGGRWGIAEHIYSQPLVSQIIEDLKQQEENLVLVSPDAGRGKWVKSLADKTHLPHDIMSKTRNGISQVEVGMSSPIVKNKIAIIFDDMLRTGTTAIQAAEQMLNEGAKEVRMIATHVILPKTDKIDAEKRLHDSPITKFYVTNSHSRTQSLKSEKFEVKCIAPLLVKCI